MSEFRRSLVIRYVLYPYWWLVGLLWLYRRLAGEPKPALLRNYLKHREGLRTAKTEDGSITSDIPSSLQSAEKAVEWLYGLLSVLDSKASALMRLNGIVLAAAAFLLGPGQGAGASISQETVMWIAALSSVSIAFCLLVVSVDWRFLGCVRESGNSLDYTDELNNLERVSLLRQQVYRAAWLVSFIASILFVYSFFSLIHM